MRFRAVALAVLSATAWCAEGFYEGSWKITTAAVAPWWSDPIHKPDDAEMKTLVGQNIVFRKNEIVGPPQAACPDPRYQMKTYAANMLFQGMFGEMTTRDRNARPSRIAASVGFEGTKWKTLETGCGNELDFHFLNDRTAMFGLNNYIYTLRKQ